MGQAILSHNRQIKDLTCMGVNLKGCVCNVNYDSDSSDSPTKPGSSDGMVLFLLIQTSGVQTSFSDTLGNPIASVGLKVSRSNCQKKYCQFIRVKLDLTIINA